MTQTHKLVPIEPTDEMLEAGKEYCCTMNPMPRTVYKAMLASAPEVGEAGTDKVERNYVYEDGIEPGYDKEPAVILALRNTDLQKRVEQLEDLLSSAYNIANRNGEDTHWLRFAAQLHVHGISPVTAKTFKILPSDEGYQPDRTAELEEEVERLRAYEEGLNDVIAWMKERGLYHDADYFGEGADFAAILTEHEQQVSACVERQFEDKVKRLVEALNKCVYAMEHTLIADGQELQVYKDYDDSLRTANTLIIEVEET